jgi:hypothetical protein
VVGGVSPVTSCEVRSLAVCSRGKQLLALQNSFCDLQDVQLGFFVEEGRLGAELGGSFYSSSRIARALFKLYCSPSRA